MSTKLRPGKYDCYANLKDDEPYFVLMGRDKHAPMLVRLWYEMRKLDGEDLDKLVDAWLCSDAMETWRKINRGDK